jgi:uncharacterized protein (DUF1501 family)
MKKNESLFKIDRRRFLRRTGAATLGGGSLLNVLSQLRLMQAAAANTVGGGDVVGSDYKALVCIFLRGGCDMNNVVIPIGSHPQANYYQDKRKMVAVAENAILDAGTVINPQSGINGGEQYGLHPSCQNMAQMFESGELGWLCNVGTLSVPTTKSNYNKVLKPDQLFSHSNQVVEWMSSISNGPTLTGWGGRIADLIHSTANPDGEVPMLISTSGTPNFLVGPPSIARPFVVNNNGNTSLSGYGTEYANALNPDGTYQTNAAGSRFKAFEGIMNYSNAHLMEDGFNAVVRSARENGGLITRAYDEAEALQAAGTVDFNANFAGASNTFGNKLKEVARLIAGRKCLGNRRQIFFVDLGGFDNHQNINGNLPGNLSTVDSAVGAFNQTMKDLAAADDDFSYADVLGFNASDFNRTFTPNGNDPTSGTDHAWGTHAFFFGGGIDGRKFYGAYPDLRVDNTGSQNTPTSNRGRWIPSTSVDQYSAILSSWLGVDTANGDLDLILPNLDRFPDPFDQANNIDFLDPLAI